MNKIYKVIWSESSQSWVAVSELNTAHGKSNVRSSTAKVANKMNFTFNLTGLAAACMMIFGLFVSNAGLAASGTLTCTTSNTGDQSGNMICGYSATGNTSQSVALGGAANASGDQSVAVGANTIASGASSVAIGGDDLDRVASTNFPNYQTAGANATYNNTSAAKAYFNLTGDYLVDFANPLTNRYIPTQAGNGAVALGVQALASGELSTAFGTRTKATGIASLALGVGANASKDGSVALGTGSTTATDAVGVTQATVGSGSSALTYSGFAGGSSIVGGDQVSIGSVGYESQLKNLAPGAVTSTSTDAINGSQLYSVANTLQSKLTHYYSVNPTNTATGSNYNNDGAQGAGSIAAGANASTTTAATNAVAIGAGTQALGASTVALGFRAGSNNTQNYTIAIGENAGNATTGTGNTENTAIGRSAGQNVTGNTNLALSSQAGQYVSGSNNFSAMLRAGQYVSGSNNFSAMLRAGQYVSGSNNIAIGIDTGKGSSTAAMAASNTVALGNTAVVTSNDTIAIGNKATGSVAATGTQTGNIAIGANSQNLASATYVAGASVAAGASTTTAPNSVAVGAQSSAQGSSLGGTVSGNASAVAVGFQANASSTTADGATAIGARTTATGGSSVAIGGATDANAAKASGQYAVALGWSTNAGANRTTAIGAASQALADSAIALGNTALANASATNGIAIGKGAQALAANAISIGTGNQVSGANSGALGDPSYISGSGTYTIGNNNGTAAAPIAATDSGAFGNSNAMPTAANSGIRIVGNSNTVNSSNAMVMGNNVTVGTGLDGAVVLGNASAVAAAVRTTSATVGGITYTGFAGTAPDAGDVVSVGTTSKPRQIQNVAAGQITSTSLDAINGSQLYATQNVIGNVAGSVKTALGGNANVGTDGKITISNIGGTGKNNVNDAIAAVKTEVVKGTNIASVGSSTANDGHTVYTVNANGTTVSNDASSAVVVTAGTADANTNITDYKVDLTTSTKSDIASGKQAAADIASKGLTFTGDANSTTTVKKLGDTLAVNGDSNITTTATDNAIKVALNTTLTGLTSITSNTFTTGAGGPSMSTTGIDAGNKVITNVASGGDTVNNAANIGDVQKAAAASKTEVTAGTNVASVDKVVDTTDGHTTYIVNADGSKVTGSSAVTVTAGTKDANNITDYAVDLSDTTKTEIAKGVTASDDIANKGLTFTGDSGTTGIKKLGDSVAVKGDSNITTTASSDGLSIALNKNLSVDSITAGDSKLDNTGLTITGGPSVTKSGINAANNKITNLANGTDNGDAVNVSQLNALGNSTASSLGGKSSYDPATNRVTAGLEVGSSTYSSVQEALNSINNVANSGWKLTTTASSGSASGSKVQEIHPSDTVTVDAGKNIAITQNNGSISIATSDTPEFNSVKLGDVTNNTTLTSTANGLDVGGDKVTNLANGTIAVNSSDAVNGSQLYSVANSVKTVLGGNATVGGDGSITMSDIGGTGENNINDAIKAVNGQANKPLTFAGDSGTAFNRKLGDTVNVVGGNTGNLTDGNIGVVAGSDTLTVKLAEAINLGSNGSIAMGNTKVNNDGLTITDGPSVTSGGIDAGGKQITNVASGGITATNAANIGDVQKAAAGAKTEVKEGDNIKVTSTTGADGQMVYTVATAKDVTFDKTTVGTVVTDSTTNKISGLAGGNIAAGSTEAVNGSQLHAQGEGVKNIIGGNTTYDPVTGTYSNANIGGTGKSTIDDAIAAVNKSANAAKSTVSQGDNIIVTPETKADGSTNYIVSTTKDMKLDSVDVGDTVKINKDGINAGNTVIEGVKSGNIAAGSGQAVNGGQIHNIAQSVADAIGGDAKVNADGSVTKPTYTITKTDGTTVTANSIGGALNYFNKEIVKPITFAGDSGSYEAQLGHTVNVKGDGKNITTSVSGNNLTIKMTDTPEISSVTTGGTVMNSNGITTGNGQGPSLTTTGINAAGTKITNVANGTEAGDAVNYGQLSAVSNNLNNRINDVDKSARAGIAGALATAGLYQAYLPGKSMVSVGGGTYRGQNAVAIGVSRISDNGKIGVKLTGMSTSQGDTGGSVSVGYQW